MSILSPGKRLAPHTLNFRLYPNQSQFHFPTWSNYTLLLPLLLPPWPPRPSWYLLLTRLPLQLLFSRREENAARPPLSSASCSRRALDSQARIEPSGKIPKTMSISSRLITIWCLERGCAGSHLQVLGRWLAHRRNVMQTSFCIIRANHRSAPSTAKK